MTHSREEHAAIERARRMAHESAIKVHLSGGQVDKRRLWMAVGYFHDGAGASFEKPCCEHAWIDLLRETGQAAVLTLSSLSGKFRRC
jgi:hypothetical protein